MDSTSKPHERGKLLLISGPSGAGKSTLCKGLLANDPSRFFSISATTRAPGAQEVDGKDYHFITPETFARQLAEGHFLEHAQVYDFQYGTPRAPIEEALAQGRDVLVDADAAGMQAIRAALPDDTVTLFMTPHRDPEQAQALLRERLIARGRDNAETIERRLAKAAAIMEEAGTLGYDYHIENAGPREETLQRVESLIARLHGVQPSTRVEQGNSQRLTPKERKI